MLTTARAIRPHGRRTGRPPPPPAPSPNGLRPTAPASTPISDRATPAAPMTDQQGPEAMRAAERVAQHGALPVLGGIPGTCAVPLTTLHWPACMPAAHRRRPAFRPLDESLRGLQKREKGSGLQTNTSYGSLTLYINKGFPTLFNTPNTRLLTATPGTSRAHRMRPHVSTPDRVRPRMPLSDHKYSPRAAYANQKYTRTFRHAHRMRPHVSLPSPPDRVRPRMPLSDHMYMHMYSSETAYTNQNISHTLRHAEGFARHDPSRLSCITPSARVHVSLPSPPNRACRHLTDECRHLTPPNACVPDHHRAPRDPPAVIRAAERNPPPDRVDLPGRTRLTLAPHRSLRHSGTATHSPFAPKSQRNA